MTDDLPTLERVRDVLSARLTVCRVLGAKLDALKARCDLDGRLRGSLAYYGAHTGRWSGRGPQPQNFPKPAEEQPAPEGVTDPQQLGGLLRGVVRAPAGQLLVTVDAAQIEARVLLWLAGDEAGLATYAAGGDAYRELAALVFDTTPAEVSKSQRAAAKVVTLACGFQGGRLTLAKFAAKARVDLAAVGITAASLVEGWRDAHTAVAGTRTGAVIMPGDLEEGEEDEPVILRAGGLWRALLSAATACIRCDGMPHGSCHWKGAEFTGRAGDLYLRLPPGRELRYRDARIEPVPSKWTGKPRPTLTYRHPRFGRKSLYGGLLCENLVQATARDILAGAMVRLEAAGIGVCLHVHDEVVCVVQRPEQLQDIIAIASEPPEWAAGLPIAFEGNVGERWSK